MAPKDECSTMMRTNFFAVVAPLLLSCVITQTAEVGKALRKYTKQQQQMIDAVKKYERNNNTGVVNYQQFRDLIMQQGVCSYSFFRTYVDQVLRQAVQQDDLPFVQRLLKFETAYNEDITAAAQSVAMVQLLRDYGSLRPSQKLLRSPALFKDARIALLFYQAGVDFSEIERGGTALTWVVANYADLDWHQRDTLIRYLVCLGVPTQKPVHHQGKFLDYETVIENHMLDTLIKRTDPLYSDNPQCVRGAVERAQQDCENASKSLAMLLHQQLPLSKPLQELTQEYVGPMIPDDVAIELETLRATSPIIPAQNEQGSKDRCVVQ